MHLTLSFGVSFGLVAGLFAAGAQELPAADPAHPVTVALANGQRSNLVAEGQDTLQFSASSQPPGVPGNETQPTPRQRLASERSAGAPQMPTPAQAGSTSEPATIVTAPDVVNLQALAERGQALVEQARTGNGTAGVTLSHYRGHYTMLTARSRSGGAEVHGHFADLLFVIDGEGTELTGGTVVDPKPQPGGETRGTRLEGATAHVLHKGDMIHIPAGTPHQAIEAPGQTITIFVVKVEEPAAGAATATN